MALFNLRDIHLSFGVAAGSLAGELLKRSASRPTRADAEHESVLLFVKILHQLVLHPYVFSSIRNLPGPRGSLLSAKYLIWGEFLAIMTTEAGILQREWAKAYGTILRAVGPFGVERVMFLSPPAMQKVLVDDWVDYPRVYLSFLAQIYVQFNSSIHCF